MKVEPECCPCMLERTLLFCSEKDKGLKYEILRKVCLLFGEEFSEKKKTVDVAYMRNEIIEELTGDTDPLRRIKDESLALAKKIYPDLKKYVEDKGGDDKKKRFDSALRIALSGNIVEFGARDHVLNLNNFEDEVFSVVRGTLAIDDAKRIYKKIEEADKILYITDNVGELIFDRVFIEELISLGKEVVVSPLSRTVQDDAWTEDIVRAGIKGVKIIPRGDFIGVWFERTTEEFIREWEGSDFIIAKGMACYETLTEYPEKTKGKVAMLFKVKCVPVSRHVGVDVGTCVVKII